MSSRGTDPAQSISPVLFLTVEGEPMSFFLRPGSLKRQLQPLITAGGGILCKVQQPGAILLIDPEEHTPVSKAASNLYISTQYIHDCIEKEEQLNLEDYRLKSEVIKRSSPRLNKSGGSPAGLSGGRVAYTPEEDVAIFNFVSQRKAEAGGNRLWQEMERQQLTSHSWQSMKSRYKDRLAKNQPAATEVKRTEKLPQEKTEAKVCPEADGEATLDPAPTHSADSDLTQIDVPSMPAASTPKNLESPAQTPVMVEGSQATEEQQNINIQSEIVEGETSHCCQTEEQADSQTSIETTEPEADGPQTADCTQNHNLPKSPSPARLSTSTKKSLSRRTKEPLEVSSIQQPRRRLTRRQLELEVFSSNERSAASPVHSKTTNSAVKTTNQRTQITEEPPQKKARGKKGSAELESQVEQSGHDAVNKTDEAPSAPQKAAKKKEKRKLGILEMATKEFEDDSESVEDEGPDIPNNEGTATYSDASKSSDTSPDPPCARSSSETGPSPRGIVPETRASSGNRVPNTGSLDAVPAQPPFSDPISASSRAHLFIFDSESQQDNPQSVIGEGSAATRHPRPSEDRDAAFSLTQAQLEEDKQRIKELMNQTNQDLVSVTKALLKTSGDFAAAADLLSKPTSFSAAFWNRHDDTLLHSADPDVRQELQEKYGEENMAKRILFLEVEG